MFLHVYSKEQLMLNGIGEQVKLIDTDFKYYMLVIKPKKKEFFKSSTKEMYEKLDYTNEITQKYNSKAMEQALKNRNLEEVCDNLYNVFEEVVRECKCIDIIKKELKLNGAKGVLMTGSRFLYLWNI